MKTTIELPDEVFTRAQEQASRRGVDVNQFIAAALATQINAAATAPPASPPTRPRSRLPTIQAKGTWTIPNMTSEAQAQIQEEDDLASYRRSFGR